MAIFNCGAGSIILTRYWVKEHAESSMMSLMVDDLDAWRGFVLKLDLPGRIGVPPPIPPEVKPGAFAWLS